MNYTAVVYAPTGQFESEEPVTLTRTSLTFDSESFDCAYQALSCQNVQVNTMMLDGQMIDVMSDEEHGLKSGPLLGFTIHDDENQQWLIPGPIAISGYLHKDCPFSKEHLADLFAHQRIGPVWLERQ
jgi:hypothetical protein